MDDLGYMILFLKATISSWVICAIWSLNFRCQQAFCVKDQTANILGFVGHILPPVVSPSSPSPLLDHLLLLPFFSSSSSFYNCLQMYKPCGLVYQGCCTKVSQTVWLQQKKFIVSQFWRWEVRDNGVNRVGSSRGLWRRDYSIPLSWLLLVHWISSAFLNLQRLHPDLCLSVHSMFFLCVCPNFSFLLGHRSHWVRSLPYSSMISTNYICNDPISK